MPNVIYFDVFKFLIWHGETKKILPRLLMLLFWGVHSSLRLLPAWCSGVKPNGSCWWTTRCQVSIAETQNAMHVLSPLNHFPSNLDLLFCFVLFHIQLFAWLIPGSVFRPGSLLLASGIMCGARDQTKVDRSHARQLIYTLYIFWPQKELHLYLNLVVELI